ncbi:MAG TPA: hypothetical protein VJ464_19110 [Blastocatellia bacterium]|nr:hypothetical protein [Blastocatellia bacterium]
MKVEESIRFAQVSLKNGSATRSEQKDAIVEAQAAEITNLDFLKSFSFLRVTSGNAQLVEQWLRDQP